MMVLLAIDQGTTNSRAIVFSHHGKLLNHTEIPITQRCPQEGWVEQDPDEMFQKSLRCCHDSLKQLKITPQQLTAIGITNQRETTIVWDKDSGKPIYPAIVWQDRRTHDLCKIISKSTTHINWQQKTGLVLDPYFSATKILWILENVKDARRKAEQGKILFGTVDTYLLWRLTKGKSFATDATNASRTLLFNIHTQEWDKDILSALNIPSKILPQVLNSADFFGETDSDFFGKKIPILGIAGDQQAALMGQTCFDKGMTKITYGTGAFLILNTGEKPVFSKNKLLTTIAYRLKNKITYAVEGSIYSAGAIIKWLRDNLNLIKQAKESEAAANKVLDTGGVFLIPAFTGLGAPYWQPLARASILGITLGTQKEHIIRAGLEAVGFQTRDLLEAISNEGTISIETLHVDGGMTTNQWLLQFIADITKVNVIKPSCTETTALGAAYLAGLQAGVFNSLDEITKFWTIDKKFFPKMSTNDSNKLYASWKNALCIGKKL